MELNIYLLQDKHLQIHDNDGAGIMLHGLIRSRNNELNTDHDFEISHASFIGNQRGGLWSQIPSQSTTFYRPKLSITHSTFSQNTLFGVYSSISSVQMSDVEISETFPSQLLFTCPNRTILEETIK